MAIDEEGNCTSCVQPAERCKECGSDYCEACGIRCSCAGMVLHEFLDIDRIQQIPLKYMDGSEMKFMVDKTRMQVQKADSNGRRSVKIELIGYYDEEQKEDS